MMTRGHPTDQLSRIQEMFLELKEAPAQYLPGKFWESLNDCHMMRLEQEGFDNFKRTITMMYFTWFPRPFSAYSRHLQKRLPVSSNLRCLARALLAGKHKFFNTSSAEWWDSFCYNLYTFQLWEFAAGEDPEHLLRRLSEPSLGNPFPLYEEGKPISQDLANSFLEFQSMTSGLDKGSLQTVVELGAGYGRTAFIFLSLLPGIKYYVVDIPPALYVSERYLSALFPQRPIFSFRPFRGYSEIREELEQAQIAFFLPHQLAMLPSKSADLFVNISSFHEMSPELIDAYFHLIDNVAKNLYFKQFKENKVFEKTPFLETDYPIRKHWRNIFWRDCQVQPNFFEALFAL